MQQGLIPSIFLLMRRDQKAVLLHHRPRMYQDDLRLFHRYMAWFSKASSFAPRYCSLEGKKGGVEDKGEEARRRNVNVVQHLLNAPDRGGKEMTRFFSLLGVREGGGGEEASRLKDPGEKGGGGGF